jgi:hypothetical protein
LLREPENFLPAQLGDDKPQKTHVLLSQRYLAAIEHAATHRTKRVFLLPTEEVLAELVKSLQGGITPAKSASAWRFTVRIRTLVPSSS